MKRVIISLLGTILDSGLSEKRWQKWRPNLTLGLRPELALNRFELLYQAQYQRLARQVARDLQTVAPTLDVHLHALTIQDPWDFEEVYTVLYEFADAYCFNCEQEDYLIHITTGTHVAQICLYLLTEARYFPARLIQTAPTPRSAQGVRDVIGIYQIIDLDLSQYDRIAQRFHRVQQSSQSFLKAGIETRSAHFNALMAEIEQVAIRSRSPILLTGPTGAGKTQLARRIYELKKNRRQIEGSFVEINCATLRGDNAMSTLFGHKKGAFTGAIQERLGLLVRADNGMVFLDEIGELGLDEQAMLLRAVEEKRFLALGADQEVYSAFQLLAGSNRDLYAMVQAGQFRADLLARLDLWTFELPALTQRREDIEPNIQFELARFSQQEGHKVTFNQEAYQLYLNFAVSAQAIWRGNFRDLSASMTRLCTLAPGGRITQQQVERELQRLRRAWQQTPSDNLNLPLKFAQPIDHFDAVQLAEVLRVCQTANSLSEAGRILFNVSRQHKRQPNDADRLKKYLAKFGVQWSQLKTLD
ncbi:MAG: RNA repair transcriptional activator RtcR [Pseudomonadota bacterium]|nr:RNA repair transcriptional activator RtcR [Pseudomonadota bacterium]